MNIVRITLTVIVIAELLWILPFKKAIRDKKVTPALPKQEKDTEVPPDSIEARVADIKAKIIRQNELLKEANEALEKSNKRLIATRKLLAKDKT